MGEEQLAMLVEVVTAALQRNYPELTAAKVEDILDLGNALQVLDAILGGIKLPAAEPKPIDDHAAVGELSGFQGEPEPAGVGLEPTRPVPGAGPAPGHFNPDPGPKGQAGSAFLSGETNSDGLPAGPLPAGAEPIHRGVLDADAPAAGRVSTEPAPWPWRPNPPVVGS